MLERFSLHKINSSDTFTFSAEDYSKFKFGSKDVSRKFGEALGHAFCKEVLPKLADPIVVISSPYCFIPTATFAMKDYFVRVINNCLAEMGRPVVEETKIHRTITYKEDYGALSAEERINLIQNDGFHLDTKFIENKTLILLDDVRITGSHEKVIERMINAYGLTNDRIYTYFGELVSDEVNPNVENTINYAYVKSLLDLDKIIKNDEFILNTRIVKYMLCAPKAEFETFAQYQRLALLKTIYSLAIGNSYHNEESYIDNLNFIKGLIS